MAFASRIDKTMLQNKIRQIELSEGTVENATLLSNWISSISANSAKDMTCLEQLLKLGDYGGMTLLLL